MGVQVLISCKYKKINKKGSTHGRKLAIFQIQKESEQLSIKYFKWQRLWKTFSGDLIYVTISDFKVLDNFSGYF